MSNIPYLEQLTDSEVVTASKAATLAFQVQRLSDQRPYKVYNIKFTSGPGTTPSSIIVFDNTLPGTLTWTTTSANSGAWFLSSNAFSFTDQNTFIQAYTGEFANTDTTNIYAFIGSGADAGKLRLNYYGASLAYSVFLELKVYL